MFVIPRWVSVVLGMLLAAVALGQVQAQAPAQTPTPVPGSIEERIQRLEKLLADTRAELAALKAAAAETPAETRLNEIERKIDILAQEIEAIRMAEAAQGTASVPAPPATTGAATATTEGPAPSALRRPGRAEPASATVWVSRQRSHGIQRRRLDRQLRRVPYQNLASKGQNGGPSGAED
jgi:hypothetical protein